MNTQNILGYYGSNLDFTLDYSEFYDFELVKNNSKGDFIDITPSYESTFNSNCLTGFTTPFQIEIGHHFTGDTCDFTIRRRTEKGWTLDFVFNRESTQWSGGTVFYYWGLSGDTNPSNYLDNNLSFQFTDDAKIKWVSYRYSGNCDSTSGYTESSYISSGITESLCDNGTSNDFNITITFERNLELKDCDVENQGGQNDLILGPHPVPYTNLLWDPTGDTTNFFSGSFQQVANQTTSGYTITNTISDWITGGTITNNFTESLGKKWWDEQNKRLGTLKIYLNGKPIYKLKNWEEIIPSQRSSENPMVQIWGGGTDGSGNLHIGETQFNLKQVNYYEEPLSFLSIRNNYITNIKQTYVVIECNEPCVDDVFGYTPTPKPIPTPTPTSTATPTPTPTIPPNNIIIDANFTPGSVVILYTATSDNPVVNNTTVTFDNIIELYDGTSILIRVSITILQGETIGIYEKTLRITYNDVNQEICEFTNFVSSDNVSINTSRLNTFVFESVIPEEQVIIDAIITDDDLIYHDNQLYISAGDNVYIKFVDPPTP